MIMKQYKIEDIKNTIIQGDCLEIMKKIPDNSIDTIITDPPYGLEFMGKNWDKFKSGKNIAGGNTGKDTPYARNRPAPSFYQLTNEDKLVFQMFNYEWAKEALRIAKPGATLLCFGSPRTYHRLTCAIEDAGWIIKDCIMWLYGSGFPKATDIAKQLAKKQGAKKQGAGSKGNTFPLNKEYQDYELTPEAKQWEGWKSHGLKPAYEPIVMAMKPNEGTYAENALKWGVAGLNIDSGRIPHNENTKRKAYETKGWCISSPKSGSMDDSADKGRFPANIILDEEAAQELDKQSGISKSNPGMRRNKSGIFVGQGNKISSYGIGDIEVNYQDVGGASRFFYVAKASRAERNMGCEELENGKAGRWNKAGKWTDDTTPAKNNHPTIKPLRLLEYLCILTKTPTGGIILDPFAGSGTTCMAAKKVGRDFIGIEKEEEYCIIARARIAAIKPESTLFQLIE